MLKTPFLPESFPEPPAMKNGLHKKASLYVDLSKGQMYEKGSLFYGRCGEFIIYEGSGAHQQHGLQKSYAHVSMNVVHGILFL